MEAGQVKLVFSPVLDHGDRSLQTHQAVECAGEQGQFWALRNLMFQQQQELFSGDIRGAVKGFAAELGLDRERFNTCIEEQRYAELVQSQDQHRRQLGIRTRPAFDVNGELVVGPQTFEIFQEIIEPLLAE